MTMAENVTAMAGWNGVAATVGRAQLTYCTMYVQRKPRKLSGQVRTFLGTHCILRLVLLPG